MSLSLSEVLMACDIVQVIQARPSSSLCMPFYTDASLLAAVAQDWTHISIAKSSTIHTTHGHSLMQICFKAGKRPVLMTALLL